MSGTMVEFPSNGKTGSGYLAVPARLLQRHPSRGV